MFGPWFRWVRWILVPMSGLGMSFLFFAVSNVFRYVQYRLNPGPEWANDELLDIPMTAATLAGFPIGIAVALYLVKKGEPDIAVPKNDVAPNSGD